MNEVWCSNNAKIYEYKTVKANKWRWWMNCEVK